MSNPHLRTRRSAFMALVLALLCVLPTACTFPWESDEPTVPAVQATPIPQFDPANAAATLLIKVRWTAPVIGDTAYGPQSVERTLNCGGSFISPDRTFDGFIGSNARCFDPVRAARLLQSEADQIASSMDRTTRTGEKGDLNMTPRPQLWAGVPDLASITVEQDPRYAGTVIDDRNGNSPIGAYRVSVRPDLDVALLKIDNPAGNTRFLEMAPGLPKTDDTVTVVGPNVQLVENRENGKGGYYDGLGNQPMPQHDASPSSSPAKVGLLKQTDMNVAVLELASLPSNAGNWGNPVVSQDNMFLGVVGTDNLSMNDYFTGLEVLRNDIAAFRGELASTQPVQPVAQSTDTNGSDNSDWLIPLLALLVIALIAALLWWLFRAGGLERIRHYRSSRNNAWRQPQPFVNQPANAGYGTWSPPHGYDLVPRGYHLVPHGTMHPAQRDADVSNDAPAPQADAVHHDQPVHDRMAGDAHGDPDRSA